MRAFPQRGVPEVSDKVAGFIEFYSMSLAVPTRRDMDDPEVQRGAELFNQIGCAACHTPSYTTGQHERADLSEQLSGPTPTCCCMTWGRGWLMDAASFCRRQRVAYAAAVGLGLTKTVNPSAGFLHDGRAETVEHAILWHDGEARAAADEYRLLPVNEREALLRFLNSL
ncbi:di-heme oxidoredictase family protein [Halopseudomonas pachastrellae]|nr:di-heme oxidoredictase family protein [Halopseudomonas pachastrellae]